MASELVDNKIYNVTVYACTPAMTRTLMPLLVL